MPRKTQRIKAPAPPRAPSGPIDLWAAPYLKGVDGGAFEVAMFAAYEGCRELLERLPCPTRATVRGVEWRQGIFNDLGSMVPVDRIAAPDLLWTVRGEYPIALRFTGPCTAELRITARGLYFLEWDNPVAPVEV